MATPNTGKSESFSIDLLRDDCKVIARRGGSAADIKKAFTKMNRLLVKLPMSTNTLRDFKKTRESRGRA